MTCGAPQASLCLRPRLPGGQEGFGRQAWHHHTPHDVGRHPAPPRGTPWPVLRGRLFILGWVLLGATTAQAATGQAVLQPTAPDSTVSGTVTLEDTAEGLRVTASVAGLSPGPHGFHIHQFGGCDNAGAAAGGHYNPTGAPHGFLPKDGIAVAHLGDLGNLTVGADGTGRVELTLPQLTLTRVAGRAVIVHEKADDFGQPTGNAGGRIACGPIVITSD